MIHGQEKAAEEDDPLAALYQKYAPLILAYMDRHIPIKEDAEDLFLEVFTAALESQVWANLNEGEQLAWLYRVAHNKRVDYYRRNRRHPVTTLQELVEIFDEDEHRMPEYFALQQEACNTLRRKIAALSPLQQEILRLRFAHGLHTKEIALRLQKTDSGIRNLLSRTLNHLRRSYGQHNRGA
ncbi:MAG TPA: sigma-70 family RNA polymerase sigma factor [Ktedonobacteraceae bacterium]|nr:sigma-70 family RNA polymerase sigma factor [Ktedonobacteraceae bacterium]